MIGAPFFLNFFPERINTPPLPGFDCSAHGIDSRTFICRFEPMQACLQADDLLQCDRVGPVNIVIGRRNLKPILTGPIDDEVELILHRPELGPAEFPAGRIVGYGRE